MELWGLFATAFLSSTLLPGGSEAVIAYLVSTSDISKSSLLATATLGNTLGGLTSWSLGRVLPNLGKQHDRTVSQLREWGTPLLLFSWMPIIGDALCLGAGWLRMSFKLSVIFIATGKFCRYLAVITFFAA